MSPELALRFLKNNAKLIKRSLKFWLKEDAAFKASENSWSAIEIACHLLDEEKEDFRPRLMHIVLGWDEEFKSISPVEWVTQRNYIEKKLPEIIDLFLIERAKSIEWLKSNMNSVDWNASYRHPQLGIMTGQMMLANWCAHDVLHLRQLAKLQYDFLIVNSNQDLSYAGNW